MHVKEAQSRLGSSFTWLCDTMDNVAKHHLGDAPNSEFVIDPRGRVVRRRPWSDPDQLRKDLTELVGPIAKPTRESTLNMPRIAPNRDVVRGVVPTIIRPNRMQAVQVKAGLETSKHPFYAKLRAEADSNLLRSGSGQLYLGFLIDPLYHVHWNNLSKPLHVEITSNNNTHIEPAILEGPQLKAESDSDPREFLVTIDKARRDTELQLDVFYYACDDDQTWCKAIRQTYTVSLEVDLDAGRTQKNRGSQGRRPGPSDSRRRGSPVSTGLVASVDAKTRTISVLTRGGKTQTYRATDKTAIIRNGRSSSFKAIRRGDKVRIESEDSEDKDAPEIVRMMTRGRR